MKWSRIGKIGIVVAVAILLGTTTLSPSLSVPSTKTTEFKENKDAKEAINHVNMEINSEEPLVKEYITNEVNWRRCIIKEDRGYISSNNDDQNDAGYNTDTGNTIIKSLPVYPGEIADGAPGRGRTGNLDSSDSDDWYMFSVCNGQEIQATLNPPSGNNYDIELTDTEGGTVATSTNTGDATESISHTTDQTGNHFIHIYLVEGDGGEYSFDIDLVGQNDAGTDSDAGDSIGEATHIESGIYNGYMDMNDQEDWYSFDVSSGQGIFISLECPLKSDFDIYLYNPAGNKVHQATYYGDDELEYPADASGTWKIKLDMFPGWDESKWPDDYFLYGSGAYELTLSIGGSAEAPPDPVPQPDITPIAQTFIVNDDPTSNKDEYGYLAAVSAANYIDNGKRYVSPIVYQGVDFIPAWFTTVDQTTQYLIDDWNTYLNRHGLEADEYTIPSDPVQAAVDIATEKWASSDTAVIAVDGSEFEDEIATVVDKDATLSSSPDITRVQPGDFKDIGGVSAKPMFIGKKWGAVHLIGKGDNFAGDTGLITPRYENLMEDWWPCPYDSNGEDKDTFYPVSLPGLWFPYVTDESGLDELQVIKYAGDRYKIPIGSTDCSIEVTVTTDEPSNLIVYLIDPNGNVRRPMVPHYNGGEIKPLHYWNGGHWEHDQDEFRAWIIEPHTEFSVNVHNAMKGKWTAIVVPFLDPEQGDIGFSGGYHITAEIRKYNPDRISAGLSAANGAVIASLKHAPLLYVTEDSVPSETSDAISELGATNIIFVNINEVSSASISGATEYTTMQEVIDVIKGDANSENFITITSLGTGDGYFAPAAMIAAYHGSPVLNIGEAKEAYNTLDMLTAWREYAGDYYHGCRSVGHLPQMAKPFDLIEFIQGILKGEFPHPGFDLKLRWFSAVHDGIHKLIADYGLDKAGQEAYMFVAPRDTDIRDPVCRAFVGNNSYAGHIPVETPAFASDVICRNMLYPAIIYANPGRDVTTSQMMNFPDGYVWQANDGNGYPNYASRENKQSFSSHGRFYEGHCIWDNLLERYNTGASISYYTGHGTGGSGISAQYKNIAEQFSYAEPRHEHLKDFDWWDAWRGYSGYDDQQTKTVRWGGASSYHAQEPNLYDIIHFKWVDQLFENLHSELEFWSSCTTGEHWGPMVYLAHGSAVWFGCAGSAYGIQDDLHNSWMFHDVLVEGKGIGESQSKYQWIFNRDFTTKDPTTLYGRSTLFQPSQGGLTNVKVLYGDPTMTCYSPGWTEPVPIAAP